MKVITPGHKYELDWFENSDAKKQVIQFIEKVPVEQGGSELKTVNNGTTNEELVHVLIDRVDFLNKKFPCPENEQALRALTEAKMWLENRTANRKLRGVEGQAVK